MLNAEQIQQLVELIIESGIDTKDQDEVTEFLGFLLEDIAGCECLSNTEFENLLQKVLSTFKS